MEHAEVRVRLRVNETRVEVIAPGGYADGGGRVRPHRLQALEGELGRDLRDLVVDSGDAGAAERVGGFDGGDEGRLVGEVGFEEGGCVVLPDYEDAAFFCRFILVRLWAAGVWSDRGNKGCRIVNHIFLYSRASDIHRS